MQFRTEINLTPSDNRIHHGHKLLCLGSCFAEHIGSRLLNGKFDLLLNPFGITYNPVSLSRQMAFYSKKDPFPLEDLFEHQKLWRHLELHSRLAHPDKQYTVEHISSTLTRANSFVSESDWVLLTLGTAHVFRHLESDRVVNNCHRLPGQDFGRELLSVEETEQALLGLLENLFEGNASVRVILTVSPVRYLRDGLVASQRSKAHLITAAHRLCEQFDRVEYFPSYELLLDDLRDYRFYDRDLAHPSSEAVDYIWEKFAERYLDDATRDIYEKVARIRLAMKHRSDALSDAHRRVMLEKIELLHKSHPGINLEEEFNYFS